MTFSFFASETGGDELSQASVTDRVNEEISSISGSGSEQLLLDIFNNCIDFLLLYYL